MHLVKLHRNHSSRIVRILHFGFANDVYFVSIESLLNSTSNLFLDF
jgi:hypothetical protein